VVRRSLEMNDNNDNGCGFGCLMFAIVIMFLYLCDLFR
jgi:hypothetical protein